MLSYRVRLEPDDDGSVLVTCPALPEVTSFGTDDADALERVIDAVEVALAGRIADRTAIPPSDPAGTGDRVVVPALTALKVALHGEMKGAGVTRADLARRLGWHREQVDRLFRLDHASRLDQLEQAFLALGRRLDISVRDTA
jgi:antitoxin HicB